MSQFSRIPLEILYSIMELLSRPSLLHFSQTCKEFHQLATPHLWRTCRKYNEEPYHSFLRTILTKPDLADHIEDLGVSDATRNDTCEISEEDIQLFQSAVSKLPLPAEFQDRLKTGIREGYNDPLLAVILCKLPNLKNLFIDRPEFDSSICELFELADSGKFTGLDTIQCFTLESEDYEVLVATSCEFGGLLNMAHEVQLLHITDETMSPSQFQEGSSAVEHLHILEGAMGSVAMRVFIHGCRTLRTFSYIFGKVEHLEDFFTPQEAVKELQHHVDTLEELTMLYNDDHWKMPLLDLTAREWYMGTDLRELTNLKKLRSGMHSLLGLLHPKSEAMEVYPANPQADKERPELVETLPMSIEHLTILYADARMIPHLQKVGDVREKQFPNLKKVIVGFCSESTDKEQIQEFEMPGLELVVLYQNMDEREAYVNARERFSWLGSPVFRD